MFSQLESMLCSSKILTAVEPNHEALLRSWNILIFSKPICSMSVLVVSVSLAFHHQQITK